MSDARHQHRPVRGPLQRLHALNFFISEVHRITYRDLFAIDLGDYPSSRRVIESVRLTNVNPHLGCLAQNRLCNGMLGLALRDCRSFEQRFSAHSVCRANLQNLWCSVGQRTCLVEKDRIDFGEFFQVQTTLDNGAVLSGPPNGTQDRERGPCRNPARSRYDYNRDGRARVVRNQERDCGGSQREVQPDSLKAGPRFLGIGARDFSARSTASMILPNVVSRPKRSTRISSAPD